MVNTRVNRERKRRMPNPQTIKKHSDIVRARQVGVTVSGAREETLTGYRIPGYKSKSFETLYEVMLPGTATPLLRHKTKDRSLRVVDGDGFVLLVDADGNETQQRLLVGDEVGINRGTSFKIATTGDQYLQLVVCQGAKYEARLEKLDDSGASKDTPEELLDEPSIEQRMSVAGRDYEGRRRGSKAKEQLKALRTGQDTGEPVPKNHILGPSSAPPERAGTMFGVNPQPSGGNFGDAGAG